MNCTQFFLSPLLIARRDFVIGKEKQAHHNTDLQIFSGLQPKVPSQLSDELEISFEWFLAPFISASQLNLGPESGRGRTGRCVGITTSLHAAAMSVPNILITQVYCCRIIFRLPEFGIPEFGECSGK